MKRTKFHAATREGMKRLLTPVQPELHKRLKMRAVEQDTTLEALTRAAFEAYLSPADAQVSAVAAIVTKAEPKPTDRTRSFLARAEAAIEAAKVDDLAGLKFTAEMEAAREAAEKAWGDVAGEVRQARWAKAYKAERAVEKAAEAHAIASIIAEARTPAGIAATEKAIARAKIEDHAVAYLRDELGEESFAKFVGMFHKIHYTNGFNTALWRIGHYVPNVACGTPINPETGEVARVGANGKRWIEKGELSTT